MRKVAKVTLYSVCLAVLLWFFLSWLDIVADNYEPNPHNSPYNVFVLMTQQEEKTEEPTAIGDLRKPAYRSDKAGNRSHNQH